MKVPDKLYLFADVDDPTELIDDSWETEPNNQGFVKSVEYTRSLSIKDLQTLHAILYAVKNNKTGAFTFQRLSEEQYEEVLKRFNETR